jgi:hypothetical protein
MGYASDFSWYKYSKTPKDYYFLRHFLGINDFRILLTTACKDSPLTLLGFIPEYIGEKTKLGFYQVTRPLAAVTH